METSEDRAGGLVPELHADEKLLWLGRPRDGVRLRPSDQRMIPFSLLWFGFAIFWEACVLSAEMPFKVFAIFGVPFILAGLQLAVGRFFTDARRRAKTVYAVSDRRVIWKTAWPVAWVRECSLADLPEMEVIEHKDGSGDIILGHPDRSLLIFPYPVALPSSRPGLLVEMVEDIREVERIIRDARDSAV